MTLQAFPLSPDTPTDAVPAGPAVSGVCALTHLGVLCVAGADARTFLQGQLTQDVLTLGADEARLAAFCNAKGRMQASFVMLSRGPEDVLLVCSRDILAATRKRLSMFVMRAKVTLTDVTDQLPLYGLIGNATQLIADKAIKTWTRADIDRKILVSLPLATGIPRALWCAPVDTAAPPGEVVPLAIWQWLAVQSGIVMVTQPIFEAFVPQMLNYESIGGVSFKKGCYPGQEIVARSQFRGTLKRRTYLAHCQSEPFVGDEVFHGADSAQPCGTVAASAPRPTGGFDALVSLQTAAAQDAGNPANGGRLTLRAADGAALSLLPLPYALLDDI